MQTFKKALGALLATASLGLAGTGLLVGPAQAQTTVAAPAATKTRIKKQGPEVGLVARVYKGPEGLTLTVLRIGPREDEIYIIKYDRVDHPWAGKWLVASYENSGRGHDYVVDHEGNDYHTVVQRPLGTSSETRTQIYLPNGPKDAVIKYDEALSKAAQPKRLLQSFLGQK